MNSQLTPSTPSYADLLAELKQRIRSTQVRAVVAVNRELVLLYWEIGREILRRQEAEGWGTKVIERLAADLRAEFPEMTGLSARNLKYMQKFAQAWPDVQIVQSVIAQLPWGHHTRILDRLSSPEERLWYIEASKKHRWSQRVLEHQIETQLHLRQGQMQSNFERTLPAADSDLIVDTRGRPLDLPPQTENRVAKIQKWTKIQDFILTGAHDDGVATVRK
ncbi:hypothetical protein HUU59_10340 [bacterium]|nr:hypothetical protein [bacterium]